MAFNPVYAAVGDNGRDLYGATPVAIWTVTTGAADTYVAGGLALAAASFGLSRPIAAVEVIGVNTAAIGITWVWNVQTQKLMGFWTGAGNSAVEAQISGNIFSFVLTVRVTASR
jgi:hypothetical protein